MAWHRFKEYVNGALWVLPTIAALLALAAGYVMSQVSHDPDSLVDMLAFQGTGDDARALLITVSSTVVTVIALVLGLTVVALQLRRHSTPRACCATSSGTDRPRWC